MALTEAPSGKFDPEGAMRLKLEWKGLRDMPKVYIRRNQSKIDDLYSVLLFCDLNGAITKKRRDELLAWLWSQMEHEHKRWGRGPHAAKPKEPEEDELRLLHDGNVGQQLLYWYHLMPGRNQDAKKIFDEEIRILLPRRPRQGPLSRPQETSGLGQKAASEAYRRFKSEAYRRFRHTILTGGHLGGNILLTCPF
jgi:hypothetical protein